MCIRDSRKTAVKWISKSINVSNNNVQTGIFKDITDDDTDFYASELNGYGIINGYEAGDVYKRQAFCYAL